MALTQNSTILISDISSALSEKQDKLAYVPVKSVNGTQADENGAVTISIVGSSEAVSGMAMYFKTNNKGAGNAFGGMVAVETKQNEFVGIDRVSLPSGGTWRWFMYTTDGVTKHKCGQSAGGTTIWNESTLPYLLEPIIAIRVA